MKYNFKAGSSKGGQACCILAVSGWKIKTQDSSASASMHACLISGISPSFLTGWDNTCSVPGTTDHRDTKTLQPLSLQTSTKVAPWLVLSLAAGKGSPCQTNPVPLLDWALHMEQAGTALFWCR
jgi:hypothetical protein